MTENEWLTATDPRVMLQFLRESRRLTERKSRLFGCACLRRMWHWLDDEGARRAVRIAESYADGRATLDGLHMAWEAMMTLVWQGTHASREVAGFLHDIQQAVLPVVVAQVDCEAVARRAARKAFEMANDHSAARR